DFKHTLKHGKDDLSLVQLGSHLRIDESIRAQDSDKSKGKKVGGHSVNMTEEGGKNKYHKQNKGKKRSNKNNSGSSSYKKPKLECWKCGKTSHFKRDCRSGKEQHKCWWFWKGVDAIARWIDSGATTHVYKDRCWFKTYEPVKDGYVLYMGDDHFAPVHGNGSVALEFSSGKTITLFNVLYVPKLRKNLVSGPMLNKCGYKQVYESDKYILLKSDYVYMSSSAIVNSSLWHPRLGHVHNKRMLEISKDDLIPAIDENLEKCTTCMLTKITKKPFQSITRKSVILELIHSDLCDFHATPSLGNKKYVITFTDDASRFCYVYLLHAKDEALDKFRIYKTEVELQQNDLVKTLRADRGGEYYDHVYFQYVGIIHETTAPYTPQQNGIAERKNRALKEMVNSMLSYSSLGEGFWGEAMLTTCYMLNKVPNKRNKTTPYELWYKKRPNLAFLRVWGCRAIVRLLDPTRKTLGEKELRDAIFDENRFSSIPRPKDIILNLDESQRDDYFDDVPNEIPEPRKAMQSRDYAFWKEAIDDEIGFIMENNTWVLSDLPPGCKWIFKRKMKVDGTVDKFKARLVIQGFRQKEGIDYYDTYAPVACITTIRLLLALVAIHNLVIHQMDVKTTFLNGDLEEEVYMKQPKGFVMPGIVITQSHYIEKILKKFNRDDCSLVSTPMDPVEKLKLNTGDHVDQLEYSRAIGYLLYAIASTRPDIVYVVGRLSRFTSNPSRQHCKAITRVFKYLRGTMNYGLSFVGYSLGLEAYSDASWINHVEDSSSTSGWVFLFGGGAISWASKKQTCITGSTMESEFVALAAADKEAKWLRNLIHEIPIWPKPIAPISIRCDSAPTMARAYSQVYNGKSRHLGVRHSIVKELIMNGVISIEFVQTQHNLADHLTKSLARDLVYKLVIGMGLKSI
nr:zinc finger, CCHC-type [Tanacetum cinerariifolium]